MNTTIEQNAQKQVDEKLNEVQAMDVALVVSADTSDLFPLREIMTKLTQRAEDGWIMTGQKVRIEQNTRVVVFERTEDGWNEVISIQTTAPEYSEGKGYND